MEQVTISKEEYEELQYAKEQFDDIARAAINEMRKEQQVLNTTADGLATTLTGAHHYAGNIVNPKRGQTEMGVMENYRIRKLTPRECFRLMDVSESDIDKIQAAGISSSQQYKMAGNSIVVSCLYHIFDRLFINKQITTRTLFD